MNGKTITTKTKMSSKVEIELQKLWIAMNAHVRTGHVT